jgi:hypothetical protein
MRRNIEKELYKIKGGDFPEWYSSLTKFERLEYHLVLEKLSEKFKK